MLDTALQKPSLANIDPPISLEVAGQRLTLFFNTESQIELMVNDIRAAAKRVWLETYIFLDDRVGRAVTDALKERVQAGVDVRVHYDALGCLTTSSRLFVELAASGVKLHCFHSAWESLRRFAFFRTYNRRNHRKVLVIDDHVAYFGGMNIVDHRCEAPEESPKRPYTAIGWRDVHVRMEGPLQKAVADSFELSWNRARGQPNRRKKRSLSARALLARDWLARQYRRRAENGDPENHQPDDSGDPKQPVEWIHFFNSGLGPRSHRAGRVFTRLLNAARKNINVSMAYFLPMGRVRRALFRCAKRGIQIQVVLPSFSDILLMYEATRFFYHRLLRRKFRIYERNECMLHSKVLVIDDEYVVLGSANLDIRSLWINREFLSLIRSKRLAAVMNEVIQREMQSSRRVTHSAWQAQPWWQRWFDRLAWSLRLWL